MVEQYSIEWLSSKTNRTNYQELKQLVYKRHSLIEPACKCVSVRYFNKFKHRAEIANIESQLESLTSIY